MKIISSSQYQKLKKSIENAAVHSTSSFSHNKFMLHCFFQTSLCPHIRPFTCQHSLWFSMGLSAQGHVGHITKLVIICKEQPTFKRISNTPHHSMLQKLGYAQQVTDFTGLVECWHGFLSLLVLYFKTLTWSTFNTSVNRCTPLPTAAISMDRDKQTYTFFKC